jgi:hypothetical protein
MVFFFRRAVADILSGAGEPRSWEGPMLPEELASLAAISATTLVAAMTTDAWQASRTGILRLFGRAGQHRQEVAEAQLDRHAQLVAHADDPDEARERLAGAWTLELENLLAEHPGTATELRSLVTHIKESLPAAQQAWVQTVTIHSGTGFIVQHGSIVVHGSVSAPDENGSGHSAGSARDG